MIVNYHIDDTFIKEENVQNIKELLDCLNGCANVWIEGTSCKVDNIDYRIEDKAIDVWLIKD